MNKYKISVTIRGAGGTSTVPSTPVVIEAESFEHAFRILSEDAQFPNNDLVETIAVKLELVQ